jgi:hypothetical protein
MAAVAGALCIMKSVFDTSLVITAMLRMQVKNIL